MPGQDRNRKGRGLGQYSRTSNALGPTDPRWRRMAQGGGTQRYIEEPLYIETRNRARGGTLDGGVLRINLDNSTQEVSGGKVKIKSGMVVPAAHAASHAAGGTDVLGHQQLNGAGANTHSQIDTHIADMANPHAVTIDQVTPTGTTGDLLVDDGSNVVALAVGSDRMLLEADAAATEGVKWAYKTYQSVGTSAANYSVVASDEFIIADTAGGNVTIDLPAVSGAGGRFLVVVRPSAANVLTIDPAGAEQVNGAGTFVVPATAYIWTSLICDGSAWYASN